MLGMVRHWFARGMYAALVTSLLAAYIVAVPSVGAQSLFTDAGGRFSFSVPDNWSEDTPDDESMVVQFQVSDPLGTAYVTATPLLANVSLDEFVPKSFAAFGAEFSEFHPSSLANAVIGGEQAKQVDITAMASGQKVAISQVFIVHDGTVYTLTIATPSGDLTRLKAQANEVTSSWEFL